MSESSRIRQIICNKKMGILYIILGLVIFALSIEFSKDWHRYEYFNGVNTKKMDRLGVFEILNPMREPLFNWVSIQLSRVLSFAGFVLLATVSLLYLKLAYLEKILRGSLAGVYFYICLYLFLFEGTAIRVAYATALIIPAFYCMSIQRWMAAVILILLASQIHFSAILFLLIIPIYFVRRSDIYLYILVAASILMILLDLSAFHLFRDLVGAVNPRYLQYDDSVIKLNGQNSTGLYFYFIGFYGVLLLIIKYYLREKLQSDHYSRMVYLTCVLAIAFMCFFHSHVAVGARLGELMLLPVVILLAWLHDYFIDREMKIHRFMLIGGFFVYFLARFIYLYPAAFNVP